MTASGVCLIAGVVLGVALVLWLSKKGRSIWRHRRALSEKKRSARFEAAGKASE